MLLPFRQSSLLLSMKMQCTKLSANPLDRLSSDGGSEDHKKFDFLVVSSIKVGLEAIISGLRSTFLFNALGPHPLYNTAFQFCCTLASSPYESPKPM